MNEENKKPILVLAPMAGITDLPFRIICKENGADLLYSEMISSTGLSYENWQKSLGLANSAKEDLPLVIQLFGNNPTHFKKATCLLNNLPEINKDNIPRKPEGIDINFGCPAPKVFKQESGCHLMKNPNLAREIIKNVCENTSLPVSIKIRSGIGEMTALTFLEKVADLNWKRIIVHGRTYNQGFSGEIDFEIIKKIKELYPKKTVIANGGIFSPEKAKEVLEKTNADGLAIARGVYGNPWIFSQIKNYLKTNTYKTPSIEEIKKTALKHTQLNLKYKEEKGIIEMRKHLTWYFKGISGAKNLRQKLIQVNTLQDIEKILNKF